MLDSERENEKEQRTQDWNTKKYEDVYLLSPTKLNITFRIKFRMTQFNVYNTFVHVFCVPLYSQMSLQRSITSGVRFSKPGEITKKECLNTSTSCHLQSIVEMWLKIGIGRHIVEWLSVFIVMYLKMSISKKYSN